MLNWSNAPTEHQFMDLISTDGDGLEGIVYPFPAVPIWSMSPSPPVGPHDAPGWPFVHIK